MRSLFVGLCLPLCTLMTAGVSELSVVYGITTLLSLILLVICCVLNRKKDPWLVLLFVCVLVVNTGYFWLSGSQNLNQALNANRLAYFGSVFLPLSIWMIILRVTRISYSKWLPRILLAVGVIMFLIAASPGILDIYYKEVSFSRENGVGILHKVYGPLHFTNLVYLLGYFVAMIVAIIHAVVTDKVESTAYAVVLVIAVFVNIAVWLAEQFVDNSFEFLSVSYIISELFLLGLHLFLEEMEKQRLQPPPAPAAPEPVPVAVSPDRLQLFEEGLERLTPKEKEIYLCYVEGMSTVQILEHLSIKENTLKFHNKNLYSKLGVSSRKQLLQMYVQLKADH